MAFTTDMAEKLTRDASPDPRKGVTARALRRLLAADLKAVQLLSRWAQPLPIRYLAIAVSKLGNGWIYLLLLPAVFIGLGLGGWRVALIAAVNAALLHTLYPHLKKRFGRRRPFHVDASLPSLLKTLDESSFPSGHAMTLTGVLAPIILAWPAMTTGAIAMICAMAWSRVATAHHYPSDVVAGVMLGAGVAYPLSSLALILI